MVWVKLDDGFPEHRKTARAGVQASWLFVSALCYSARNGRDGLIPEEILPQLTPLSTNRKLADKLVEVGLFERTEDGFRIHDYEEYQPSTSTERVRRHRAAQRNGNGD